MHTWVEESCPVIKNSQQDRPDPWTHTSHLFLFSIRATAASAAAAGTPGPRAVPQTAAQLGARRGRLLSRSLLHPADAGAAQRRLAHPFVRYKPQLYLLGSGQVSSFAVSQPPQSCEKQYLGALPKGWPLMTLTELISLSAASKPHVFLCRAHEGRTIRAVWRECY